ncbi:hypothetical protein F5X68DRAFT_128632 [Plectosphaerella plurivora]|uniref:D-lactate dehydrogenase n=1 Tax=Plectosphaerella plurivora TaxID=936078 RepID=A0A9P8VJQ9_9PEZI|nr:hypothetical protein F5X68DRAFT_128632 [Plectosphaerella plurivora]
MDSLLGRRREDEIERRPARRRGTACERCHRRRTKCDSSVVGLPCTSCRKSGQETACTILQSKRKRGSDGRYMSTCEETRAHPQESTSPPVVMTSTSSPATGLRSPAQVATSSSSASSANVGLTESGQPPMSASRGSAGVARRQSTTAQPNIVGESWYASYVMRGYKPGHASFHSPLDDCNETVQSTVAGDDAQMPIEAAMTTPRSNHRTPKSTDIAPRADAPGSTDDMLPPPHLLNRLVKSYFDRFHVFCPILERPLFLASLAAGKVSITLVRSVLFVASVHCDMETVHNLGYATRFEANRDLHARAAETFDDDRESDRTSMVLASYLLHYWYGNPASYRDSHWWIAAAIRSAQCMGYHRSTKNTRMPPRDKARWRRVWWCLYIRDVQISLSTGTPKIVNDLDHDVEELVPDDLPDETPETVQYIIAQMQLCRSDHHLSLTVKVCYNYFLINLYQRLQRQSPRSQPERSSQEPETTIVVEAAERILGLVEDSLLYWTPEHFPMIYVSALFSAMVVLAADGTNGSSPGDNRQRQRRIRPGLLALKQFEPIYILASWIRNLFMNTSKHVGEGSVTAQAGLARSVGPARHPATPQSLLRVQEQPEDVESVPQETEATDCPQSTFDLGGSAFDFGGAMDVDEGTTGMAGSGFWPLSLPQGVLGVGSYTGDNLGFPQPESLQYQALHFLADLSGGLPSRVHVQHRSALQTRLSSTRTTPPKKSNLQFGGPVGLAVAAVGLLGGSIALQSSDTTPKSRSSTLPLAHAPPIEHDTSRANIEAACQEFTRILGPDRISTDGPDLLAHSGTDYQSYAWSEDTAILSQVILYPQTTEEVSDIAKYITDRAGVVIDFSQMSSIVELNTQDLDCTVQPGIGWMDLNEELASHGLFFPPDPGPGAMIGGMVGTGCSGTNAAAYGTMKDWVLSLTVVLADGTVIKTRQRARKSSAGYDLTRTFVGSEGTLGLVTEATLKLAVKPPREVVAVCTFPTLREAASAVSDVIGGGIQVAAVELLDDVQMRNINTSKLTRLRWREEPTLFFKFTGSDDVIVEHVAKQVDGITKRHGSTSYTSASGDEERAELWSARKNALWSMLAARESPTDKVWTTDVAVPLSKMPEMIEEAKADIERSGLLGSVVGHVGDGNFHTLLLFSENKREVAEGVVHRMIDKAIALKGTATGEHGVGLVKRDYLEKELGREAVDAMRAVSAVLDVR